MYTHTSKPLGQRLLSAITLLAMVLGMFSVTSHAASTAAPRAELLAEPAGYAPQALQSELPDNSGREFWLAFPINSTASVDPILFITGRTATTGTVTIPGLSFTQDFSVTPGDVTSVAVPMAVNIPDSDLVGNLGIHVVAGEEVAVYGLNRIQYTTDAYLGLPVDVLGTSYMILQYVGNVMPEGFAIVATADNTTVVITPTATVGARTAGAPYQIIMNAGQTYQLQNSGTPELSGTAISSDKPIGVYGAVRCVNIPTGYGACDHIVEQLPPTTSWGKAFVTVPLATRTKGDTFRFLAAHDDTTLTFEGANVGAPTVTLNHGEWHERLITSTASIVASEPILVMQYSNGIQFDGVTSDPFMMLIPPYEQFGADYTVSTPAEGFVSNYINVVAPTAAVGSVILDGAAIPAGSFSAIGSSGFHGAQVAVALGVHNLSGPLPFGVFAYGFDSADSYGYPGGMGLAAVATVANISITLPEGGQAPVGAQYCITATATNAQAEPVNGVRVDFNVTGVHTETGFSNTNAAGEAPFCYTGDTAGSDTVVAAVGTISDTATIRWAESQVSCTSLTDGNWSDPDIWDCEGEPGPPGPNDNAVIPNGISVTVDQNVDLGGNLTITGTLNASNCDYVVTLVGNAAQTLTGNPLVFCRLTVNKDNKTDTVTIDGKLQVTRRLTVRTGKLISASDYEDIEIEADGELQLTSDITVGGHFTNTGTLTTDGFGVTFDGGKEQRLVANTLTTFDDLTVAAGTTLVEAVSDDNVVVYGTLTNNGVIRKTQAINSEDWYYFGLASNEELAIDVTTDNFISIMVERRDQNHPGRIGAADDAGVGWGIYWTITPDGSGEADLTLPHDLADDTLAQACRFVGGKTWDCARDSSDEWTVTREGVTTFSDWAVGNKVEDIVEEAYVLTVHKAGSGDGSVVATVNNGTVLLPGTLENLPPGTMVTLFATAAPTSTFIHWGGDVTGDTNPITITMDANKSVTATFYANADLAVSQQVRGTMGGLEFTIVASNLGPQPAPGAVVSDTFPTILSNITWTCTASGGAVCPHTSGTGDLHETLATFPANSVVTYTVSADTANSVALNTVTITAPEGIFDPNLTNNSATRPTLYRLIFPIVFKDYTP